ncbi:hypothetical protein OGAPHI_001424 [Ogataea philodendri]|uniref:Uncharacterized protein n=1 Tax=Ogataea philodendri TaxID=1378263 RepID=A0A9P8T7L2_9ASCO|nr:uncharacterized protein OGAPHI_001424 [Ogataea philodendri]KAH3669303.1 hypothetical protein OGAPHI_001424 [Ogataea philodendri]
MNRRTQLERIQKADTLLERVSETGYFVDDILDTDDAVVAESVFNEVVVVQLHLFGLTVFLDRHRGTFLDQVTDSSKRRSSDREIRTGQFQQRRNGRVQFHKCSRVDVLQTEQIEDFSGSRRNLGSVRARNPHDKKQSLFCVVCILGR